MTGVLFAFLLAGAIVVFVTVRKYRARAEFITSLYRFGGEPASIESECPRWVVRADLESYWPVWARSIHTIRLREEMQNERYVRLLQSFPEVRELYFSGTVEEASLRHLCALKNLELLELEYTDVGNSGMKDVGCVHSLRELHVIDTPVGDAGVAELIALDQLATLSLEGTKVSDQGICRISQIASLIELNISATKASDGALECISNLPGLRRLYFVRTNVTDAGMKHLESMSNLEDVSAQWNDHVSEEAVQRLGEQLHLLYTPGSKVLTRQK